MADPVTWTDLRREIAVAEVARKDIAERLGMSPQEFSTHLNADRRQISRPEPVLVERVRGAIEELLHPVALAG